MSEEREKKCKTNIQRLACMQMPLERRRRASRAATRPGQARVRARVASSYSSRCLIREEEERVEEGREEVRGSERKGVRRLKSHAARSTADNNNNAPISPSAAAQSSQSLNQESGPAFVSLSHMQRS